MIKYFWEIHEQLPQQGPGNNQTTLKAFEKISPLPNHPNILDIGCGPGRQTIVLAKKSSGPVTAIDNHQPFLDELDERAATDGLTNHIITLNQSMDNLKLEPCSFDLIWSEGAVYIIGFEKGLTSWKQYLKPRGFIAVTEVSWLTDKRPDKINQFWTTEYPAIKIIEENYNIINQSGYNLIDSFTLSENCWHNYYNPIRDRIESMRQKYKNNTKALTFLDNYQIELDMYDKYSDYYGYVFYIMSLK